jgi:hypothetical protein
VFKSSQSEALSIYPVVRYWLVTVVRDIPTLAAPVYSFLCLCDVMDLVFLSGRGLSTADDIRSAVETYLEASAAAHGEDSMIPKHHYLLHLYKTMLQIGWLPCCMVLERKHKGVKKWTEPVHNLRAVDHSVLRDLANESLYNLQHAEYLRLGTGLIKARAPSKEKNAWLTATFGEEMQPFFTSDTARFDEFETCSTGDVVAVSEPDQGWRAVRVWFHFSVGVEDLVACSCMDAVSFSADGRSSEWRDTGHANIVELDSILAVFIHADNGVVAPNGCASTLLHPFLLGVQ